MSEASELESRMHSWTRFSHTLMYGLFILSNIPVHGTILTMESYEEIYLSYNDFEADIIEDILSKNNIPYILRDQRITPYPLTIDHFPEQRFAVPLSRVEQAEELISKAIQEGALPGDGTFKRDNR